MAEPELGSLAESVREAVEVVAGTESLDRFELAPRRAARAHEVRVVCVREPVRPRARLRHDRTLLEREHGLGCSHEREQRLDRLPALRIGDRMRLAIGERELRALRMGQTSEQRRGLERSRAQLDVRRAAE